MNYHLAYIVSHGFAARMVTQTDLLRKIANRNLRVALIAPDQHDPILKAYCRQNSIDLFEFNEQGKLSNRNYMFKRKYFLENLEHNPALWEKHMYALKFNKSLNPLNHIWPRYYGLIYRLIKKFPSLRTRFMSREKSYLHSPGAKRLLENLRPKKLVATYPVNFNEAVLLHAGNKLATTETWIHLLSWDNITCKGHFPELADQYIAWGPIMKEELQSYYQIAEQKIHTCGVPHFDLHAQVRNNPQYSKYTTELGLDSNIPYLFFAMSSPRFAPKEIDIVEWLAKMVKSNQFKQKVQIIIRPHPQNVQGNMADRSWLPRLQELNQMESVAVDMPQMVKSGLSWSMNHKDMIRLAQLLAGSTLVLNSGSTVSIDALSHHKPVILTSFDADFKLPYWKSARRLIDYTHLKKLISYDGISVVHDFHQLSEEINQYLMDPLRKIKAMQLTLSKECSYSDGSSTNRVVQTLG